MSYTIHQSQAPSVERIGLSHYLKEYDDMMSDRRKTFSAFAVNEEEVITLCRNLLKTIFRKYIGWTPEQIRDCLTPDIVAKYKLKVLIDRLPCPPELDRTKELCFVAWDLYPRTKNVSDLDLVRHVYDKVLDGRLIKFPKGYFGDAVGEEKAIVLFQMMMDRYLSGTFCTIEEAYDFFSSSKARAFIDEHRLITPLKELFSCPLDYFHASLGDSQRSSELYMKYVRLRRVNGAFAKAIDLEEGDVDASLLQELLDFVGDDLSGRTGLTEEEEIFFSDPEVIAFTGEVIDEIVFS